MKKVRDRVSSIKREVENPKKRRKVTHVKTVICRPGESGRVDGSDSVHRRGRNA